jgi:hypothetical protein
MILLHDATRALPRVVQHASRPASALWLLRTVHLLDDADLLSR